MSNDFPKVPPNQTIKEALKCMYDGQQNCVLIVDAENYLEGILTYGDIKRFLFKNSGDASNSNSSLQDVCEVNWYCETIIWCVHVYVCACMKCQSVLFSVSFLLVGDDDQPAPSCVSLCMCVLQCHD